MCQFRQASEHCYLHEHQLSKKVSELVDDDQKLFWWRSGKQKDDAVICFNHKTLLLRNFSYFSRKSAVMFLVLRVQLLTHLKFLLSIQKLLYS